MIEALVDQDIRPRDRLERGVGDRIRLSFGVENTEDAVIDALADKRILFTTSRLPVTGRVLERTRDLDLVAKIGTGLDSIDLEAATDHGTTVVYTPGVNALSVAEHALALLLAVNRKVLSGQRTLEAGGWRDSMSPSRQVAGGTVGLVGFGNVGRRVAGLLAGFNVDVLAYDPYVHEVDTHVTGATLTSFETVLSAADALIVTAESTEETRGLIAGEAFELLSEDATLVNTARGAIIDQDALIAALQEESLRGAGLDVFETEPLPADSPLYGFENVVLTPHIAASTLGSREAAIDELADLALTYLDGEELPERFVATSPR